MAAAPGPPPAPGPVWPRRGLGPSAWADDPRFDIGRHVRAYTVPAPGNEVALLAVCAELNEPVLDRSRSLWELWLLPGLADGNVGMLFRLHHAVADGIAATALMGALFEAAPARRHHQPRPGGPSRPPAPDSCSPTAGGSRIAAAPTPL